VEKHAQQRLVREDVISTDQTWQLTKRQKGKEAPTSGNFLTSQNEVKLNVVMFTTALGLTAQIAGTLTKATTTNTTL